MVEGGKNIFGVRDDITNPWKTEKENVVQGLVGAVGREGHGQGSQHMGSDRIFLLDVPPKVFGPTSENKLKGRYWVGEGISMFIKSLWYLLMVER